MKSIKQFFEYMNDINFPYVVLRNWDNLPYDAMLGEHSDLDILVYDFGHWKEIFPQAEQEFPYPRVRFKVPIDDSYIYVDVRHIGDNYYPEEFERSILSTREFNGRGFYTPNKVHFEAALAYHIVHHKSMISETYRKHIGNATVSELFEALKQSNIGWVEPLDKSVGAFNGYWKGATSVVSQDGSRVIKQQVSYNDYNLLQNEYDILSGLNSRHFPEVFRYSNDELEIEHCGKPVTEDLPADWKSQLKEILSDLKANGITHRDIKVDNLMVKDGTIKLIDFGWAIKEGVPEKKKAPSCLGFPNKPSWGFDDRYSMERVIKQIEFHLEEVGVL